MQTIYIQAQLSYFTQRKYIFEINNKISINNNRVYANDLGGVSPYCTFMRFDTHLIQNGHPSLNIGGLILYQASFPPVQNTQNMLSIGECRSINTCTC